MSDSQISKSIKMTPAERQGSAGVMIRLLDASDEDEFIELAQRSLVFHQRWIVAPKTADAFKRYFEHFDTTADACFVVCKEAGGSIVGFVSLNQVVREPYHCGKLGYGVFVPYVRCGYLRAGVEAVVQHAFADLSLHRLEADIQPHNIPSSNLIGGLGFQFEGISKGYIKINGRFVDHDRWAVTSEMWSAPNSH